MSKAKKGNYVKIIKEEPSLDIVANELAQVRRVFKDEDGERELELLVVDGTGKFYIQIYALDEEVEIVGKRIIHKEISNLAVGDLVVLDGEEVGIANAEVGEITHINRNFTQSDEALVVLGEGFKVVVAEDELNDTVPVVV